MVVKNDRFKEDKVEYETFHCQKCGEELLDGKQLGALAKKYRELRKSKDITFSKWGNSIAVRIPSEMVEEYGIKSGSHGTLTKDKEGMKIIPV
jgi:hypothetical protein